MIAIGVRYPALSGMPYPRENPTGSHILDALFYLSLATAAFWIYRMKGLRWLSASLLLLQELILVSAGFIAGMAVSGDWL